jgi:hypothetical protein
MKATKLTILKGEGANQHTLYGDISFQGKEVGEFQVMNLSNTVLKHETPAGNWSNEHHTLSIPSGISVMGQQVEYNPFKHEVTRVWD